MAGTKILWATHPTFFTIYQEYLLNPFLELKLITPGIVLVILYNFHIENTACKFLPSFAGG